MKFVKTSTLAFSTLALSTGAIFAAAHGGPPASTGQYGDEILDCSSSDVLYLTNLSTRQY